MCKDKKFAHLDLNYILLELENDEGCTIYQMIDKREYEEERKYRIMAKIDDDEPYKGYPITPDKDFFRKSKTRPLIGYMDEGLVKETFERVMKYFEGRECVDWIKYTKVYKKAFYFFGFEIAGKKLEKITYTPADSHEHMKKAMDELKLKINVKDEETYKKLKDYWEDEKNKMMYETIRGCSKDEKSE